MKKSIILIMTLAVALIFGGFAWAEQEHDNMMFEGRHKGHHKGMDNEPMRLFKKLDLTQEQQELVDKVIDQYKGHRQALHEQIDAAKKNLHQTVRADQFDEQKIRTASQTLASSNEEIAVLMGNMFSDIRQILTPEQIEKMAEMRERRQKQKECREKCRELMVE